MLVNVISDFKRKECYIMLFVNYPKCTTCVKARKFLEDKGIAFEDRHIKDEKPTYDELKLWHEKSGSSGYTFPKDQTECV